MQIKILLSPIFFIFISTSLIGAGCKNRAPISSTPTASSTQILTTTLDQTILTPQDFTGFGLSDRYPRPQRQEQTFRVQLRTGLPVYLFHVLSKEPNAKIQIFRSSTSTQPIQTLLLDPNRTFIEDAPLFFNISDINFDGYPDIGILAEGGALWAAFEYWTYDIKSGTFVRTPAAEDMRQIKHNGIVFNPQYKEIITNNLIGAIGGIRSIYQYADGRIYLKKEYRQENTTVGGTSTVHCTIQIITYRKGKNNKMIKQEVPHECGSIPDTF